MLSDCVLQIISFNPARKIKKNMPKFTFSLFQPSSVNLKDFDNNISIKFLLKNLLLTNNTMANKIFIIVGLR